ncbi:MAG TPA: O-antigen ligase family protein [Candidatus Hydrogenedentes bacterium]|nr:O-antigen ligase family protein [Candidatus Hydrogenedentota bacterium]HPG65197.1 O-antigen ligase family protein [Candidatus Hydrogenedentota bacterium]
MASEDTLHVPADRARGIVLLAVIVLGAVVYSFRFTSFLHAKESVVWLGACLLATVALAYGRMPRGGLRALAPLGVFLLAAGVFHLAVFRGPVPGDTAVELLRIAGLFLFVALVYDLVAQWPWQRRTLDAVVVSAVVVATLGVLQYIGLLRSLFPVFEGYNQRIYSVFGNQDLFGGYVALAIPVLVRLALARPRPRGLDVAALAVLLLGLLLSGCRSAWLAMAAGVLVALPYGRMSRLPLAVLAGTCLLIVAGTALLAREATLGRLVATFSQGDTGGRLRLWFWAGAFRMGLSSPIIGRGLGGFAYWSPQYLGNVLHATGGHAFAHNELHTMHAHCEPLEVFAETGLVGVACGLWFVVRLVRAWRDARPRSLSVEAAAGGLAALGVFALFNAACHSAPHALVGLLFASIVLASGGHPGHPNATRGTVCLVSVSALLGAILYGWAVLAPSRLLAEAENRRAEGSPCLDAYARAVAYPWPNARAREGYAVALAEAGRYDEAYEQLGMALQGLDTGDIYLALAGLAARAGRTDEAERCFVECYHRWPSSPALWELWHACRPEDGREALGVTAAEWGVAIDGQGRAYSITTSSKPNAVMDTEAPAGPATSSR